MDLHEACYVGRLDVVRQLLADGADPNAPASGERAWISATNEPRPLNCVVIARAVTQDHVSIARLLIEHGAIVDESVLADHAAESMGGANDAAMGELLRRAP